MKLVPVVIAVVVWPAVALAGHHKQYAQVDTGLSCNKNQVVWVNTNSGVYHYSGERWYGRTKYGQFECERDAVKEGDRATRNGQ